MRAALGVLLVASCAAATVSRAAEDGSVTRAKTHFRIAKKLFTAGNFEGALLEFEAARAAKALPEFSWNIGLCLEQLDRPAEAIAAFQRFIDGTIDSNAIAEAKAKIKSIEERRAALEASRRPPAPPPSGPAATATKAATAPPPAARSRYLAPLVVGGVALALAAVGTGLVVSIDPAYNDLKARWLSRPTAELQSEASSLQLREQLGYGVLASAGAAAVVDAILWGLMARRSPSERRAFFAPTRNGVLAGGVF